MILLWALLTNPTLGEGVRVAQGLQNTGMTFEQPFSSFSHFEQVNTHEVPADIIAAATKVRRWFAARGIDVWALAGCDAGMVERSSNDSQLDLELP